MREEADTVVVGGGIVGVCTAYSLARRGSPVSSRATCTVDSGQPSRQRLVRRGRESSSCSPASSSAAPARPEKTLLVYKNFQIFYFVLIHRRLQFNVFN